MKKGITILALAIVVVIMSILAGVGIYFSEDIMKSVEKNEFSIELLNIQTILDTYYIENGTYPTLETLEINLDGFGTFELSQFDGENINDNIVTLWELDLNSLGIQGTALGRSEDDEDIYAVSLETGKVYYVRGVTYRGKTHYTLNADLSQSVKADIGVNGKRIKVKDVIFVLPKLKVVSEAVSVTVVLPKEAVLDNIVASNSVQIGNKTIYGDYQLIEVNKTNIKVNYEIEVTYTLNGLQDTVKYVVNNVDVDGPIVEINEVSHTNYITLKIQATDNVSEVVKLKYEISEITDSTYFDKYGKNINGNEINCYTSGMYTIYAVDSIGNATLKYHQVTIE